MKCLGMHIPLIFILIFSLSACSEKKEPVKEEKITIKVEAPPAAEKEKEKAKEKESSQPEPVKKQKETVQIEKKQAPPAEKPVQEEPKKRIQEEPKKDSLDELNKKLSQEYHYLKDKGLLPRDIPQAYDILKNANLRLKEGKTDGVDKQLDDAHRIIREVKIDKDFIERKIKWVKLAAIRPPRTESSSKIKALRDEAEKAYHNGDYIRANQVLTLIALEARKGKELRSE